jgi:hypothetical protein
MISEYVKGGLVGALLIVAAAAGGYLAETVRLKEQPSQLDQPKQLQAQSGCTDYNVLTIVSSLRQHPGEWSADDYHIYKDGWGSNDVYIWTANEDYGLDIARNKYGSNTNHYPFSNQCRALLYKNVQAWQKYDWNRRLK